MANIDDILNKHRASLSQAQIDALIAAADAYSRQNAGNRAGALASARQQYDTGYRGLQNMGLAGASGAAPTSGEVPRLEQQVRTPFDQYNDRLHDVERSRVNALGENFAYQNQLAAEEARRRALAEEEARRQAAARETDQARFQRAQAVANAINRNRTFGKVTAADLSVPSRKEYEASTTPPEVQAFNQASAKAANAVIGVANNFPSVMARAAAAMVGLQDPYSAINTAQQNEQLGALKDAYQKADAALRGAKNAHEFGTEENEAEYKDLVRARDDAKAAYDAEKSRREADRYRREAEKIKQQDPEYYDAIVTANNAKATPESRKSASRVIADRSVNNIVQGMGFTKTMTDKEYDDAKKVIPDVRMQLNIIDSTRNRQANGGTGDDDVIGEALAELKKMGYSEDSARELVRKFETDRNYNREYTYLIDAYTALQEHYGDKPEHGVNQNEKDYTYRMVNGLDTGTFTGTMGDALMSMWRDDKKIIGKDTTKYMTDEQRDAYNAIYEKDGIKAANEYIKDILPLIETQRAAEDQKWLEEMASKDRGGLSWLYANTQNPAWLLARATNLIGSIPAMAEKLAVNARNLAAGATGELKKYSPDSSISRISNWSDIIQAQQSKNILEHYESKNQPGMGKVVNFMYNTGTSMADSMIAMGVSGAMGSWATDALFFSSAGNQAYKDAIERGGTQEQAMGVAFASGLAEALFEHLSLEKLTQTLQFKGKTLTRAVKDMLTQAGVEGSEELFTELSNVLTDFAIMKDKSEMQQAINSGELGRFLWDRLSSATLGGLASGFLFGVAGFGGAVIDARADSKTKNALGTRVRENGDVQQVRDTAILLGGEAAQQAEKVQKRETNANVGEMTATVVQQVQSLGEGLSMDQQVAAERIIDGAQMTAEEASNVYELLGKDTVEKMNYDGSSAEAFQKSYNDRVKKNGVVSKEERRANAEEFRSKKKKQEAAERVWKDPNLGYTVTKDGQRVKNMPGDLTAVSYEDQQKSNFAARTTAKVGKATYEIAGMEAREGMTDEQKIAALKKNMNKSQVARAEFVESLANALGVDMVIHDDMGLANGYVDNDGKIHFSLSSKQSILRVASHELTHKIREVSEEHFNAIKDAIIKQVGEDTFNERVEQKKQEYEEAGVKLDPDLAIEETVTEYSEKMLQDTDFLEDFVDENPEAAKTLKGELLKILNAVKRAFKRTENRNYGQSFSNEIEYTRDTLQAMYNGLEAVMERAQNTEAKAEQQAQREESVAQEEKAEQAANEPAETAKREPANDSPAVAAMRRQIERLKKAGDTAKAAELEQKLTQWQETTQKASESDGLYMTEESRKAEEVKKAVEESAQKKTYVPGYTAKEVEKVLSAGVFGDRSNYEGNDYENARGMIAQLIPDIVKVLQEDPSVDLFDVNDRTRAAVGEMLKNYFEDDGDMTALREAIPSVIGVDTTAKGDLKSKDQSLFQMSAKLSKALGKKVTLVSETNAKGQRNASYKSAEKLEELWERVRDQFGLSDDQDFSVDLPRLLEFIEQQSDTRRKASDLFNVQEAIDETAVNLFDAVKEMLQEKTGKKYSLDTDEMRKNNQESMDADYMRLANKYKSGKATEAETTELRQEVERAAEESMPDSVARGKDGKLMKFFHGTKAEFTKFERSKIGSTGRFEGSGFNFTPFEGRARSYGGRVLEGYLDIKHPLSAEKKTISVAKLAQLIRNIDPTGDNIIANYAQNTRDYGSPSFIRRESLTTARALYEYADNDVDMYSDLSSADPDAESLIQAFADMGYDGLIHYNDNGDIKTAVAFSSEQFKVADPVTYDDAGNVIPLSERFNTSNPDIRYSIDTDAIRDAFTIIDTEGIEDGLEALKGVTPGKGLWALKDISRFLDSVSGGDKNLRNTLHAIFEAPHSDATGRYARGVERMQQKVLDIASRAGVCDAKGKHFDSKKSAAIQNIGEGFSNTYTNLKYKVKDAEHVTVQAYDPDTKKLVVSEKDYTLDDLRHDYGQNVADYVWDQAYHQAEDAQAAGGEKAWQEQMVNTRPYTLEDLQKAFPDDWQKLERAANEFREMYDDYIRTQNSMLATIYPIESEYESVEKLAEGIEAKEQRRDKMRADTERRVAKLESRLEAKKTASENRVAELEKKLSAKEKEMASKRRTDTKAFRDLQDQAFSIRADIENEKADIAEYEAGVNAKIGAIRDALNEYEANVKDELRKMGEKKAEMQNAISHGEGDSLKRMHRLHYRSDYFHHFTEMASGIQNLKAIFKDNTDISPAIVGKSGNTRAKTKWAGYFQQRMGGDYTADAINGMLKYGQLAEYKLAFDPLTAYLRDVEKKARAIDDNTNRDNLIRYIGEWTNAIMGKSHTIDRALVDSGLGMRSKLFKTLDWINSRVIQNTLLFNMRSALIQGSNLTNAKGLVRNNVDWANGLRSWALAAKGDEAMAAIMAQSNFLASRYMDNLQLTDSKLKSAKAFAGWMLGALDEFSAKATWWAAYQQYTRNPNAKSIQRMGRTYESAVDYADDVTRRTHAGRGVGELAPAMTSRVINLVAPFQVEVNNTYQLLKDNVRQKNYLGLLSTGVSVFLFNTFFEAIVGSTPLGFDFIRAIIDICFGLAGDDPDDDDDDYGVKEIGQRLAGELAGGLPFAGPVVGFVGQDFAKKILGEDTDVTRYGNTQIGLGAITNTVEGIADIGKAIANKRNLFTQTNFISDIDDLLNLTLPFGGKQLARTAEGIKTVAQGYGSKVNTKGEEQVQFMTGQNILNYLHAGLFGKWALTEASEYFGEKRLLPQVFGAYNGPKSSLGKPVDAKEYKAALQTGIDGRQYFSLKYDLAKYKTQGGKRAEMMEQSFTPEQKAKLDALLFADKDDVMKTDGALVYKQGSDGEWDLKVDYTDQDMFDLSMLGAKVYDTTKGLIRDGFKKSSALTAAHAWDDLKDTPDEIEGVDDRKLAFRNMLMASTAYTPEQKAKLDKAFCNTKTVADYTSKELFDISIKYSSDVYDKAKEAEAVGIKPEKFVQIYDKWKSMSGKDKKDQAREYLKSLNLSKKEYEYVWTTVFKYKAE